LITGVSGFAGSHLAEFLLSVAQPTTEIWGCDRSAASGQFRPSGLRHLTVDLRDAEAVRAMLRQVRPDHIYHLAAQASVADSWARPWETFESNLRTQINLMEAVLAEGQAPRILIAGSMEEYGRVLPEELPLNEQQPFRPDSPYGVSKVGQDLLGLQYFISRHLPVIRVRPFNHIGPRQSGNFVAPAFASQIAAIEAGQQPPVLKVGNLAARRDFTDVRDMVRAYAAALQHGAPGEVYNIGSGRSRSIQELLDILLRESQVSIRVETDPTRLRPADNPDVVCDARKFQALTGWAPQVPFETSLRDLLNYERRKLRAD
jgi:GDP-4-dehydro-6-deoxy-D-mannose reductase